MNIGKLKQYRESSVSIKRLGDTLKKRKSPS